LNETEVVLVRLSSAYDLASFDCGDQDLNEFLVDDALEYQKLFLANTTLMLAQGRVAAYFSLSSDAIQLSRDEKDVGGIGTPFSSFPALKIARLATDTKFQGLGYGRMALEFCIGLARHFNDEHRHDGVGCRFVTVDAYPSSADWYLAQGFVRNEKVGSKNRETTSLRLDALPFED
jgi:GNAT superfamily N-acetyltransferase